MSGTSCQAKIQRKRITNTEPIQQITVSKAKEAFIKACRIKNLRPDTLTYYREDIEYFAAHIPVENIRQMTKEVFEDWLDTELQAGKKASSLNTRIRGLRPFFKYCAGQKWMKPLEIKLMKTDDKQKEPYTEDEMRALLKKPESAQWTEWRTWAMICTAASCGCRASSLVGMKVKDINFVDRSIFLSKLKNRLECYHLSRVGKLTKVW